MYYAKIRVIQQYSRNFRKCRIKFLMSNNLFVYIFHYRIRCVGTVENLILYDLLVCAHVYGAKYVVQLVFIYKFNVYQRI